MMANMSLQILGYEVLLERAKKGNIERRITIGTEGLIDKQLPSIVEAFHSLESPKNKCVDA